MAQPPSAPADGGHAEMGLQFAPAHDAANTSQDSADKDDGVADSQEIVVGSAGRAIVLGDEPDVASDGGDRPDAATSSKGPCPLWLRGSSRQTKGVLCLAALLMVGFVAILIVGVVQLPSSSSGDDEAQLQQEENAATDPTNAVPAAPSPTPKPVSATPPPVAEPVPDMPESITIPIPESGVNIALPASLEAKVPDFSDGLDDEEEENWTVIEEYIETTIYESLTDSLPADYALGPIRVEEFDGYATSAIRRRILQNNPGTVYNVLYSSSVEVDCSASDCTVASDTVADATADLSEMEYLEISIDAETFMPTPSPEASTPAPTTPSPTTGTPQPTLTPSKQPSAQPATNAPTPPVALSEREDECSIYTPCERCQGACADATECEVGLLCFQRRGYEFIPGCEGPGAPGLNYCYDPLVGGLTEQQLLTDTEEECDKKDRCDKCQGNCDDQEGCENGLFCFRRNEFELVPGCAGQGTFGSNYCFDPADLQGLWDE